ncbi:GLPGLI family protein [Chryseobacterium sp. MEBOG06]|uniref:GLPGLI family protein n=1 Tax=Chryseobacterium sp. MEBOG06 TaxID=2879938 RepID=UPI001F44ADAF|nr:GLPGLI family protein [Chryseobacterium sp. MEBOG06]UKB85276.1 GLPGLI family protein [Chryseobacterium sp. MEBOG06]
MKKYMSGNSKTIKILICILFCSLSFGQNTRVAYEYIYKIDSLNKERIEKEVMFLDILKEGSHFYSYPKFVYDSLKNVQIQKVSSLRLKEYNFSNFQDKSKTKFSVEKKYPEYEILLQNEIGGKGYTIIRKRKLLSWNILPDKKKVKNYTVQKATTSFGGRDWVAWFTNEIPFSDGPYCFYGLPGLILTVEDTKGDHIFNLIGIKKDISSEYEFTNDNKFTITEQKFNKIWNDYKKDPSVSIKSTILNSSVQASLSWNGEEVKQSDIIRNFKKQAEMEIKTNNNFLELELYK